MAFTSVSNVRATSTSGDTITGSVLKICTIIVKPGSTSSTCTLTITGPQGTVTAFESGTLAANSGSQAFYETMLHVGQGQTLTANLTGTGCTVYLYVE